MAPLKMALASAAVGISLMGSAYGQAASQMDMQGTMQAMMPNPADPESVREFKAVHMKMMMNSPKSFSGDTDADFARSMIAHHQAGIEMAKVELQHGKDAKQRQFAQKVIAEQEKDIADLQAWLKAHGK